MNKQLPKKPVTSATAAEAQNAVHLGTQHGYSFEGEVVRLNAELQLPAYLSRGDYSLELWACANPCEATDTTAADPAAQKGALRVAKLETHLPTPLSPILHWVEGQANAQFPSADTSHAMVLALVQEHIGGERVVVDVVNYSRRESFPAPQFRGDVAYEIDGNEVVLRADSIANDRGLDNQSGTLALELVALPEGSNSAAAVQLASFQLAPISGGYLVSPVVCRASYTSPGAGQWRTQLVLREWSASNGYVTRDQRATAKLEIAAPKAVVAKLAEPVAVAAKAQPSVAKAQAEPAKAEPAAVKSEAAKSEVAKSEVTAQSGAAKSEPVAVKAEAAKVEPAAIKAEPAVSKAEPAKAEPALAAAAVALVSLQTASVEEIAKLEGLNERIAKEIIKARPLKSWSDVVKLRGVGQNTLQKLKTLASI